MPARIYLGFSTYAKFWAFQLVLLAAIFFVFERFLPLLFFHVLDHSRQTLHTFWIILVKRWPNASVCCICLTHMRLCSRVGVVSISVHCVHVLHTCLISCLYIIWCVSASLCVCSRTLSLYAHAYLSDHISSYFHLMYMT